MNKRLAVKVVGICLIFLLAGVYMGYSAAPSLIQTISTGVVPGAPSYTIYQVSGTYYAKDQNGYNEFSGADATTVIQAAFDTGGEGCSVVLRGEDTIFLLQSAQTVGVANWLVGLIVPAGASLEGIGKVTIKQDNNLNLALLIINDGHNPGGQSVFDEGITIKNLWLDGNYAGQNYVDNTEFQAAGMALTVSNSFIQNIYAVDFGNYGVVVVYGEHNTIENIYGENGVGTTTYKYASVVMLSSATCKKNDVRNIHGVNNQGSVLWFEDYANGNMVYDVIEDSCRGAITGSYSSQNKVLGVDSYNSFGSAVLLDNGQENIIETFFINYSAYAGIKITGATSKNNKIIGGFVINCGRTTDAFGIGFFGGTELDEIIGVDTFDDLNGDQVKGLIIIANQTRVIGGSYNNMVHGIDVADSFNVIIQGVTAANNAGYGVLETGTSDYTLLDSCNLRGNTGGAHTVDAINSVVGDIIS